MVNCKRHYLTYQLVFVLNFILCYIIMKMVSWKLSSPLHASFTLKEFFGSPYVSVRSLKHRPRGTQLPVVRFLVYLGLMLAIVLAARKLFGPLNSWEIVIISPAIYFMTEALGALGQVLFPFRPSFPIHQHPFQSKTLGSFWGRHWNLWVQDWLRDIAGAFQEGSRFRKIAVNFIFSGIFHELMCNLPFWLVYKKSYFGTMMAYFLIQAMALWIEKKYIRIRSTLWRRLYCWCAVIIPAPLFINVPLLTFLGLEHV